MTIDIIQIVSAVALVIVVLLQNRGTGLGSTFGGGGGGGGKTYGTRRSAEKLFFNLSIVLAVIFFVTAIVNFLY